MSELVFPRKFDARISKPINLVPVLAYIEHQNDLGLSRWAEVVTYDSENKGWEGYHGGTKFQNGEQVISWVYVEEVFSELRSNR